MSDEIKLVPDANVVEEVWVGLEQIAELVYLDDGRRLVRTPDGRFESFEQFFDRTGLSVKGYLSTVGQTRRNKLDRAIKLVQSDTAYEVEVTCSHRAEGHAIQRRVLRIYDDDQVKFFETRHGLCIIDMKRLDQRKELG